MKNDSGTIVKEVCGRRVANVMRTGQSPRRCVGGALSTLGNCGWYILLGFGLTGVSSLQTTESTIHILNTNASCLVSVREVKGEAIDRKNEHAKQDTEKKKSGRVHKK